MGKTTLSKIEKKTIDSNIVLGVMRLFDNEEYYKYAIQVLWGLRALAMNITERNGKGGMYWDKKHPDFWIADVTNEIIGRALIDGYYLSTGSWYVSIPRSSKVEFMTYNEARSIAGIVNESKYMDELRDLRDSASRYANDINNPAYNIYKVTNDLLGALTGDVTLRRVNNNVNRLCLTN